ncbi:MAG: hypothetical protein JWO70_2214 [Betaproteobacteria bacterium]|nr:hypothetical protein [Betaproteobacteria bacterium]
MAARHALVAGATGIVGTRVVERFAEDGWRVTGLCRRPPADPQGRVYVGVDLTDAADCISKLAPMSDVTHIVYAARYDHPEGESEAVGTNASMLRNLIDAVEPASRALEHVHLVHGTKYYGHMLGPLAVPLTEESPRARVANFYFEHEDWIRGRRRGKRWTFSTSRPHTFCDDYADEPRSVALLIAVYASIARACDEPLAFPGSDKSFHARTQFTHVPLLAKAIRWMSTEPCAADESYNVTNGDSPSWSALWPRFADYFGVEAGGPGAFRLADYVADKESVWQALVRRCDLQRIALSERVLWPYADYVFKPEWDIVSDTSKARRGGFTPRIDSAEMFLASFDRFRENGITP